MSTIIQNGIHWFIAGATLGFFIPIGHTAFDYYLDKRSYDFCARTIPNYHQQQLEEMQNRQENVALEEKEKEKEKEKKQKTLSQQIEEEKMMMLLFPIND
ncbi:hypothetical protein WA158_003979 [Blastocystis sp. Blastoise]